MPKQLAAPFVFLLAAAFAGAPCAIASETAGQDATIQDSHAQNGGAPSGARCGDPERGLELLIGQAFLPEDFSEQVFDNVWQVWPERMRLRAQDATPQQRRAMAFERYGLTPRPGTDPADLPGDPLQYVVGASGDDGERFWTMNCFSCHGGEIYGRPYPGAPNNRFALQTMTEELRATKLKLAKPLTRMDLGSLVIPLGTTHGTTNAVVFGVGLMARRDTELNVIDGLPGPLVHHDLDAPPWWHFYKRPYLYIDGFAERGHRGLMQFTLVPENGPEFYRRHEEDFRDVYAYLMSLRPPMYDGPIDHDLAARGADLFNATCSRCHGTYGEDAHYPNVRVPLDELGTDPARMSALSPQGRQKYADSWFAVRDDGQRQKTVIDPDGYVAPPLDGVWASPPYFHNGSVPTLWHVLHPAERPVVWRRRAIEMDDQRVGLQIESVARIPLSETDIAARRQYFDTRRFGKSAAGHDYPDELTADEKLAVLEYLKTL